MLKKTLLVSALLVVCVLGWRHAARALQATLPPDMPVDAQFLTSGYDLAHNEPQGNWITCRLDVLNASDWCRVTDEAGHVVYEGAYLPVGSNTAVGPEKLRLAAADPEKLWVASPAHQSPVPVLPLVDGTILVPAEDDYALNARWQADPTELMRVKEAIQ